MEFTHIILVLVDNESRIIVIKSTEFTYYDRNRYLKYDQKKSFIITCSNAALARKIRSALDAVVFDDLQSGLSYAAYRMASLDKLRELATIYVKHVKGVSYKTFDELVLWERDKSDFLYHSLNFHKAFDEIIRQIDHAIAESAYFNKVKKQELKSIIYGKTAPILNDISVPWAYNQDGNIVIDYSGIVSWKAIGVFVPHRQLVELKYFL